MRYKRIVPTSLKDLEDKIRNNIKIVAIYNTYFNKTLLCSNLGLYSRGNRNISFRMSIINSVRFDIRKYSRMEINDGFINHAIYLQWNINE